jgi:N-acetylneuraminic acid mutarotase
VAGSCTPESPPPSTVLATWATRAPSPQIRYEANGTALGGRLYVLGGFIDSSIHATTSTAAYDPSGNSWADLTPLPEPVTHSPAVVDGTRLWLLGGLVGHHPGPATADVWIYDTEADTWTAGPSLPAPRGAGAGALLGRTIHFFGGAERTPDGTGLVDRAEHWALDLDDLEAGWQARAPLPDPRNHLGGAALDGRIYGVGGQHGADDTWGNSATVSVYDPGTDAWTAGPSLPEPRGHITASTVASGGRILVAGGTLNGNKPGDAVRAFDPADGTWLRLPPLPSPRKGPVVGVIDGDLLAATGNGGGAVPTDTNWSLRRAGRWEVHPAMPVAMGDVAAGVVGTHVLVVGAGTSATYDGDLATGTWRTRATRPYVGSASAAEVLGGKLYVVGGTGTAAGRLQVFDPAANRWTLGPAPPFAASAAASAVVGGKLYLAGGLAGGATTAAAARFDPASGQWESLPSLPAPRDHAAGGTDGRRFLLFGGTGPGSGGTGAVANGFATVQAFDPDSGRWATSDDAGSGLAPLPQGRGGAGRAVAVGGRLFVLGGETATGPGATSDHVYRRVDVYDPGAGTWSEATPMPTARHGIWPVVAGGRIYVVGGDPRSGASTSTASEAYNP